MKFRNQVKRMVAEYPSLFPNRESVLNHLFLVIGNGYDWINGQLVDPYHRHNRLRKILDISDESFEVWRQNNPQYEEVSTMASVIYETTPVEWMRDYFNKEYILQVWGESNGVKIADGLETDPYPYPTDNHELYYVKPYPMCGYSNALCVPEDVQPDWLEAVIETLEWVLTLPIDAYNYMNTPERTQQTYESNRQLAEKALEELRNR